MKENLKILHDSSRLFAATTLRGPEAATADPYSGFSLCHYTGDSPMHFEQCREQLVRFLDVSPESIAVPRQTHSVNVAYVNRLTLENPESLDGVDALVTDVPGIAIGVNTADCLPVVLADEERGIIGVVHAGWRGAAGGIIESTLERMRRLGAERISAWLAPAIGVECFEVGEEVASRFPEKNISRKGFVKPHVDLAGFARDILEAEGAETSTIGFECTRCNPLKFFSARASGISSGRNFTFAMLKNRCGG